MINKPIRERIVSQAAKGAYHLRTPGLIGHVIKYYPPGIDDYEKEEVEKHLTEIYRGYAQDDMQIKISDISDIWHTADVVVKQGEETQTFYNVPCFVYGHGLIDKGLEVGDQVWIQFINGDINHPIITGYYRTREGWNLFNEAMKLILPDFISKLF